MQTPNPEYSSFLVRLWREPPALDEPADADEEWVAQVEHIPSGEKRYFSSLEDLFAFIHEQAAAPACRHGGKGARGPFDGAGPEAPPEMS